MSVDIDVQGFSSKDSPEFKKHFAAVKFCVEHDLSLPKETSAFFHNKIDGCSLEVYAKKDWVDNVKDGIPIDIPISGDSYSSEGLTIKVADIPSEVDQIIVKMC